VTKRKRKRERPAAAIESAPVAERSAGAPPIVIAAALAVIVFFGVLARLRLLDLPLERDEGEYAYAGQLMLQGIPPYTLAYNMKFPGTYAAYALIEALFGHTIHGIRIGLIVVTSLTTLLVYFLGARLFGRGAGMAAAAAYAMLSVTAGSLGIYAHATHFVMLPAVGAFVLLAKRGSPWRALAAGALLALAVLMKQPGAAFAIFGVLWMLAEKRWRDAGMVTAGGVFVAIVTAIWLTASGVFGKFWFWTVQYAREYAGATSLAEARNYFTHTLHDIIDYTPALWLTVAIGVVLLAFEAITRRAPLAPRLFVIAFIAVSFIATAAGLYFRPHYFILTFPACALAAGGAVAAAMRLIRGPARFAAPIAFAIVLLLSIRSQWPVLAEISPERLTKAINGDSPFNEAPAIGDYLREHTAASDRVVIFGSEPEIFFYADRKSATGYIYMYPLMEHQPFAARMQKEMISEVERANPKYIVYVTSDYSWLAKPDSNRDVLAYADKKIDSGYRVDGVIDELPGGTVYTWGPDAERYQPKSRSVIFVFRRAV